MRYPKKYTSKEWSKFSWEMQERLCKKYNVFLEDHTQPSKLTMRNINAGIDKVVKGIDQFSKSMNGMHGKHTKDYSFLLSKSSKKTIRLQ